ACEADEGVFVLVDADVREREERAGLRCRRGAAAGDDVAAADAVMAVVGGLVLDAAELKRRNGSAALVRRIDLPPLNAGMRIDGIAAAADRNAGRLRGGGEHDCVRAPQLAVAQYGVLYARVVCHD